VSAAATKQERQAAIVEVLRSRPVETQQQLAVELRRLKIEADQATISRDLRQLGVARVGGSDGRPHYLAPPDPDDQRSRIAQLLGTQLLQVDVVGSMTVLHTPAGAGPVVAAAVDAMGLEQIAGTVAGDDTIFVQARSAQAARLVASQLQRAREEAPRGSWGWGPLLSQAGRSREDGPRE
jgi:transcriptional regulator of arginine metabolism